MRSLLRSIYLDSEPGELIELEPAGTGLENPYVYDSAAREVVAGGDPRGWFNVGWLRAQLPDAVDRCGKCLRVVVEADPFWR